MKLKPQMTKALEGAEQPCSNQ